ncbi:MAG: STAS domain-containing protein [Actinomycetota bacterium]
MLAPTPEDRSALPPPKSELHVHVASGPDHGVITLTGELDGSSAAALQAALAEFEANPPGILRVDLSGLTFMDSSGLRLLLEAHRLALAGKRRLVIVPGPPDVQGVFEVTGVEGALEFS